MQKPRLFDGAFGTYYYALTGKDELCELANLSSPDVVRRIHREYLSAGSRIIRTNTFAANPAVIEDEKRLFSVLEAAYALARECAAPYGAEVFCSIGPAADKTRAAEDYLALCSAWIKLGAETVLFETLDSLEGVEEAISFLRREAPKVRIAVSFAAGQDGTTARGLSLSRLILRAAKLADLVGLNCRMGPAHMRTALASLPALPVPLFALPNAGYPAISGGRTVFENNPEYFAEKCAELLSVGASFLGGCCGTTPQHVARLAAKLSETEAVVRLDASATEVRRGTKPSFASHGKKFIAVELDPPVDADLSFFLSAAQSVIGAGADAVTVSDSPFSKTRADALLCSVRLLQEKIPAVIPHVTCRDKNHVALKGGLLAASAMGIDRVFLVTGDPPLKGEIGRTGGVFSFNSFELIQYVSSLNEEVFFERPFSIGAALNVNAANFEKELLRAQEKVCCGADFFLTQPVFSERAAENLVRAREALSAKLFCGIMPVGGYKNALFLKNEVVGTGVPDSLIRALEGKSAEEARGIALGESKRMIDRLYDACDGFFLMLPLKKVDYITELVEYIAKKE